MSKKPVGRARSPRKRSAEYAAAEFKMRCLALMDRVRETGVEYVVTKHGKPVAKLVPFTDGARPSFFGALKGTVLKYERPFEPIDGTYDIDE